MKKALLLYNPAAGRFPLSRKRLASILEKLLVMGISAEAHPTLENQNGTVLPLAGKDMLILYGGDGTIHQVLPAVLNSGVRLAVLPAGTANVLAKELGIPRNPERALRLIAAGRTRHIHIGEARTAQRGEPRYFHLMAGVGLDAYVISRTNPRLKRTLGWASYWWAGIQSFWSVPLTPFQATLDGVTFEATFAVVSNCRYYGGQLLMAPQANLLDGSLDVYLFTARERFRLLAYLAGALDGRHVRLRDVVYRKASRVSIQGDSSIPVQMDGDVMEHLPVEFSSCSRSIEVFAP